MTAPHRGLQTAYVVHYPAADLVNDFAPGDMLLVDVAELGSLIPRSKTQVDDAFLQELAAEVSQLATPSYRRIRTPVETAIPPVRKPDVVVQDLQRIGGLIFSHLFGTCSYTAARSRTV